MQITIILYENTVFPKGPSLPSEIIVAEIQALSQWSLDTPLLDCML